MWMLFIGKMLFDCLCIFLVINVSRFFMLSVFLRLVVYLIVVWVISVFLLC